MDEPVNNKGVVKFYNSNKGFGFITEEVSKKDIFFHITQCPGIEEIQEGTSVEFGVGPGRGGKGEAAINIKCV